MGTGNLDGFSQEAVVWLGLMGVRAGAKAQRQEAIWQGIHENLDTAISSGLSTFVRMRALATQARVCWRFTVLVSSAKKKSSGSQEKAKKNSFVNIQKIKMCFSK